MSQARSYDAIIAGGGHNGLTAGAYLARAGLSVLVVERSDIVGGAAVSRELEPGWTYSNCSYVCSLLRPEVARDLDLARHGLQVIPYTGGASFTKGGEYFAYHHDQRALEREIARLSPRDVEGYERFARAVTRQCRFVRPLLLRSAPDPASFHPRDLGELLFLLRRLHDLGEREMGEAVRFWTASVGDFLDGFIEHPLIKAHLAGSGIIGTGLGVYSPGTAYVLLHHYMGDLDGAIGAWGFARGGMGAVSAALAGALRAAGGEIRVNAEVERILVKDGAAAGVVLKGGEEIRAPLVASNMDAKRTFLGCVEPGALPDDFLDAVRRFRIRGSSAKLNIALDGPPVFPAVKGEAPFLSGDLHASESLLELEAAYDDWKEGRFSAAPYFDMLIPSRIDPTMAPPGAHMASIFVQYAPYDLARDGVRDPAHWDEAAREGLKAAVLDKIEAVSPGFRGLIRHSELRAPVDIEREVGLSEGNIFQGELTFDQLLFNRPVPGWARHRSPLPGLWLVGSSAHPGGGVMAAAGANAAREILRDMKRGGRDEAAFRAA